LSPRLAAMSHRPMQRAGWPIHVDPHVGRLSPKVKPLREAASLRIIPTLTTSAPRMPRSRKEHPAGKKKTMKPMGTPWKP
jgi:hypothetical protein